MLPISIPLSIDIVTWFWTIRRSCCSIPKQYITRCNADNNFVSQQWGWSSLFRCQLVCQDWCHCLTLSALLHVFWSYLFGHVIYLPSLVPLPLFFIMLCMKRAPSPGISLACRGTHHCLTSSARDAQYKALFLGVSSACHTWRYCCNFSALGAHLQASSWGITIACWHCHHSFSPVGHLKKSWF